MNEFARWTTLNVCIAHLRVQTVLGEVRRDVDPVRGQNDRDFMALAAAATSGRIPVTG